MPELRDHLGDGAGGTLYSVDENGNLAAQSVTILDKANVTQITSRTTGVTLNKNAGRITLVSAAGSTSWQTFTVSNNTISASDVVERCQKSGTDTYEILIHNVTNGSFDITFRTTGGTTTEQPAFNFAVTKVG
jgi:hypothetical protein